MLIKIEKYKLILYNKQV